MFNAAALYRRWLLGRYAIPAAQWRRALAGLPYGQALDAADQRRLHELALLFLTTKTFEGAAGLRITDAMRLSIALQACLLVLNLGLDYYAGWSSIVVYPGDFLVTHEYHDEAGVVHRYRDELSGESWPNGPVILSWQAVRAAGPGVQNPVLHEFAHKLDMLNGEADGFPPLPAGMDPKSWTHAFHAAYHRLHEALVRGEHVRIDDYAAENPAEFFAVVSEAFFLEPEMVQEDFPAVYRQLKEFYRQDPAQVLARHDPAARR